MLSENFSSVSTIGEAEESLTSSLDDEKLKFSSSKCQTLTKKDYMNL